MKKCFAIFAISLLLAMGTAACGSPAGSSVSGAVSKAGSAISSTASRIGSDVEDAVEPDHSSDPDAVSSRPDSAVESDMDSPGD